jgi:hypothetical protein
MIVFLVRDLGTSNPMCAWFLYNVGEFLPFVSSSNYYNVSVHRSILLLFLSFVGDKSLHEFHSHPRMKMTLTRNKLPSPGTGEGLGVRVLSGEMLTFIVERNKEKRGAVRKILKICATLAARSKVVPAHFVIRDSAELADARSA